MITPHDSIHRGEYRICSIYMKSRRQHPQLILAKLAAIAFALAAPSGVCQINSSEQISKEEYAVVSIALGKRTERAFISGHTSTFVLTLRQTLAQPQYIAPQQRDPALTRPRREPTEEMLNWSRYKRAERQDGEAFKAEISEETVNDWMEKNSKFYEWENHFDLGAPTLLLTSKLNEDLPRDPLHYWEQLRTGYPDLVAIESASRVGFNRSHTQAVVLVGYRTGLIGGGGQYVLLEKKNNVWEVRHRLCAWLS